MLVNMNAHRITPLVAAFTLAAVPVAFGSESPEGKPWSGDRPLEGRAGQHLHPVRLRRRRPRQPPGRRRGSPRQPRAGDGSAHTHAVHLRLTCVTAHRSTVKTTPPRGSHGQETDRAPGRVPDRSQSSPRPVRDAPALVRRVELALVEREIGHRQQVGELLGRASAGDRRGHGGLRGDPGECDGGDRGAVARGDLVERSQHAEPAIVEIGAGAGGPRRARLPAAGAVLPRQEAAGQSGVGDAARPSRTHRSASSPS